MKYLKSKKKAWKIIDYKRNKRIIQKFTLRSVTWIYKKRFNIKTRSKMLFAISSYYNKVRMGKLIVKRFFRTSRLYSLENKYCVINLILKYDNNTFLNYSHLNGDIINNFSRGYYFKKSLKKSYFAFDALLCKSKLNLKYIYLKKWFIFNIFYSTYSRKIMKNLKELFVTTSYNIRLINLVRCKAHNGVRKAKARRK